MATSIIHAHLLAFFPLCRIVNAVFVVFELIGDTFISWLPMYYELKLGLVVWLTLYNGATIMYDRLVHRYDTMVAMLALLGCFSDAAFLWRRIPARPAMGISAARLPLSQIRASKAAG